MQRNLRSLILSKLLPIALNKVSSKECQSCRKIALFKEPGMKRIQGISSRAMLGRLRRFKRTLFITFCMIPALCFSGTSEFLGIVNDAIELSSKEPIEPDDPSFHPSYIKEPKGKPNISLLRDLCYGCALPIYIGGYQMSGQTDFVPADVPSSSDNFLSRIQKLGCICKWRPGFKIAFWEPQCFIEVTRVPYRSLLWDGLQIGSARGYEKHGAVSNTDSGRTSFYNVHQIGFPLFRMAAVLPGFTCLKKIDIGVPIFLSEWDPAWNDPSSKLHWLMDPERMFYASAEMQLQCKLDCIASSKREPRDDYPWCAGCLGCVYPLTGHVGYHIGGVQASSLLMTRWLALVHSMGKFLPKKWNAFGLGMGFEPGDFCRKKSFKKLKKTIYKTQLVYPSPEASGQTLPDGKTVFCHPLGESDKDWGSGRSTPSQREDFGYLVWTKMHCCFDVADVLLKALSALEQSSSTSSEEKDKALEFFRSIQALEGKGLDPSSISEAFALWQNKNEKRWDASHE